MIVAIKKEDRVVVGMSICDGSVDMSAKDLALADNLPFWKVKGEKDCYVFATYLVYSADLLRYNDYVFKGITDGSSVVKKVIPKIKELLASHNLLVNDKEWRNQLLIIKGNKMFTADNFLLVKEVDDHIAMGIGESYLQGALDVTSELEPTERILTSVRNTNRLTNRLLFPITIFDSKSKRKKVYYQ